MAGRQDRLLFLEVWTIRNWGRTRIKKPTCTDKYGLSWNHRCTGQNSLLYSKNKRIWQKQNPYTLL